MMTKHLNLLALCLGAAVTAFAADSNVAANSSSLPLSSQIASEARTTAKVAGELATTMKKKNADFSNLNESVAAIEKSVAEINRLAAELDAKRAEMPAKHAAEIDRIKQLSELMQVFLNNKKGLVPEGAAKREMIRVQAEAVKTRAALIVKSASKLGV